MAFASRRRSEPMSLADYGPVNHDRVAVGVLGSEVLQVSLPSDYGAVDRGSIRWNDAEGAQASQLEDHERA